MGVRPACGKFETILQSASFTGSAFVKLSRCIIATFAKVKVVIMVENAVRNLGCLRRTLKSFPGRSSSVLAERGS